ncbi:MAG: hypothetical protein M3452_02875 [Chloroflexota bacterium]|nr:hypothetical protein [Chloroflexota bacterium]
MTEEPRLGSASPEPDPTRPGSAPPEADQTRPYATPGAFPSVDGTAPPPAPRRGAAIPLVLAAVAVLVVLAVGLLLFLPRGGAPSASGSVRPSGIAAGSPSPSGDPSTPTPGSSAAVPTTPTPSGTAVPAPSTSSGPAPSGDLAVDPAVEARIREIIEQVPAIRGLEARQDVPFRFITAARFEEELRGLFAAENPAAEVSAEEDLLKRLGLLGPEADLEELVLDLYGSQVAAFYDTRTASFTVVQRGEGSEFGSSDALVVAHEYVHALQDQHFVLEGTQVTDPAEGDQALGVLGLIEGDAVAVMVDWAIANLSFEEILGLQDAVTPADQELLESMPPVLRRQLEFPYIDGWAFVTAVRAGGGYAAVDAAFADRPASTEQIMHPEKYIDREEPIIVRLPGVVAALGSGWAESYEQTLGEMLIGVLVADGDSAAARSVPGVLPALPNAAAAAGWGGDRLVSVDGPEGTWAVVWQTAWDSATDADEFSAAAEAAMEDLPFPHEIVATAVVDQLDSPVLVIVASDEETLEQVGTALPSD